MINPLAGDKPIAPSTEHTAQSGKSQESEQTAGRAPSREESAALPSGTTLEVDQARQLYELENQKARLEGPDISTPEEARSLLDRILEQISGAPEQAMSSQGSRAGTALALLLQTSPS